MNSRRLMRSPSPHTLAGGAAGQMRYAKCRPSGVQSIGSSQPARTSERPRPERGLGRSSREESWSIAGQPGVPDVLGVSVAGIFDLEPGFDNVGGAAAEQRFLVKLPIGVQMIVGPLEPFEPVPMRSLRPIAMRGDAGRKRDRNRDGQDRRPRRRPSGKSLRDAKRHWTSPCRLAPPIVIQVPNPCRQGGLTH